MKSPRNGCFRDARAGLRCSPPARGQRNGRKGSCLRKVQPIYLSRLATLSAALGE